MTRNTLPGFALVLLALPAFPGLSQAATIDRQAALDSLLAAEKAFAADAAAKGIHDSFLDFLADNGVLFRPDPMNGKEFLRSHPPAPGFLSWVPAYSEISMGGDLGYNTGPYEYRRKAGDAEADTGQFATVWQRQADGSWKVLVDLGTAGPAAASPATPAPPPPAIHLKGPPSWPANGVSAAKVKEAMGTLFAADHTFSEVARAKGEAAAYAAILCDDARLLRDGVAPVTGKEAIRAALATATAAEPRGWEVEGGGVARSGDFGYTYGVVLSAAAGGGSAKTANYLRAWRQVADGSWKLAFDVLASRPKQQPAPAAPAGSPAPNQTPPTIPPLHPSEPSPPPPNTGNR
jgi:ketosteroid isomerase-like protein